MTAEERGRLAATKFNANNPAHFPGRPLFEGLVMHAVEAAIAEERDRCAAQLEKSAERFPDDPRVQAILRSEAESIREMK